MAFSGFTLLVIIGLLAESFPCGAQLSQSYFENSGLARSPQFCRRLRCPETLPAVCDDTVSSESRTVVTPWDNMKIMCDTKTDGGGWLVIQRRFNGSVDFYRNWEEYKAGFGNINSEFWFGNENIHRMTILRPHELRIDLKFQGLDYHATYSHFQVLSESELYRLEISGYSGNAGDAMGYHNHMPFSTKDRDNSPGGTGHCAQMYSGAWWYNVCHTANLNGLWGAVEFGVGLNWRGITTSYESVTFTEMKIRPLY